MGSWAVWGCRYVQFNLGSGGLDRPAAPTSRRHTPVAGGACWREAIRERRRRMEPDYAHPSRRPTRKSSRGDITNACCGAMPVARRATLREHKDHHDDQLVSQAVEIQRLRRLLASSTRQQQQQQSRVVEVLDATPPPLTWQEAEDYRVLLDEQESWRRPIDTPRYDYDGGSLVYVERGDRRRRSPVRSPGRRFPHRSRRAVLRDGDEKARIGYF